MDLGRWTLNPGRWRLGFGRWILDTEHYTVDVKTLTVQSFGNIEAISITSFFNSTLIRIFDHFRYENLSTVFSFQATLSNHLKISRTSGFQMMWRGKVDLT